MLARVYGIDDAVIAKRVERARKVNQRYTAEERAQWQRMRETDYPGHTKKRAAELIARAMNLESGAAETIRRAFTS